MDALALNINASYSGALRQASEPSTRDEHVENYLAFSSWQIFRLSNTTNALSLKQKLWMLGYSLEAASSDGGPESRANVSTHADAGEGARQSPAVRSLQELLEREAAGYRGPQPRPNGKRALMEVLARAEHDRWMAFYLAEGWTHESPETSNTFKELGLNDAERTRHDSHLLLKHPFICSFEALPAVAAQIGRDDPTPHDLNSFGDLARIVADARGFAGRAFPLKELDD